MENQKDYVELKFMRFNSWKCIFSNSLVLIMLITSLHSLFNIIIRKTKLSNAQTAYLFYSKFQTSLRINMKLNVKNIAKQHCPS